MHKKLFIPGPTEVREDVLKEQARPMIGHRMKDFSELYEGVIEKLKKVLNTEKTVLVATSSGTGLMEGAIRNCVKGKCLNAICGAFSERWHKITLSNGKEADSISVEWGKAIKPEMIEEKLKAGGYDSLTLAHNETSTGVMNPLQEIAEVMRNFPDIVFMVDAVSSMGGVEIDFDGWGIDVCVSSSQKALALPPGLAVIVLSEKAIERAKNVENRGYYFDFPLMIKYYEERHQTPSTPAISLLYAMDKELDIMLEEGMENRFKRHREMADLTRDWVKSRFALFPEEGYESITLTTARNTRGISVADLNKELNKRGFAISNGYGKLKETTFRIAHMGELTPEDIKELLSNIDEILGGA